MARHESAIKDRDAWYGFDLPKDSKTVLHEDLEVVGKWLDANGKRVPDDLPGFTYGGIKIVNPFYDESMRFEVEPLSYYGDENIFKFICQVKKEIEKEQSRASLDDQIAAYCKKQSRDSIRYIKCPELDL